MSFRLPEDEIPDEEPYRDREFLRWAYHDRGLSPRAIAYALGVSKSHITVYLERYGMTRKHRHEPTLRRLHIEQGLSPDEIAECEGFNCTTTTVRKYLSEYGMIEADVGYGRLDELGSESPSSA